MRSEILALDLKTTTKFAQSILQKRKPNENTDLPNHASDEYIGGVIRNGQFSWIAAGSHIEIYNTKTGSKIARYTFDNHSQRPENTLITCVTEVTVPGVNSCILVIGVQCFPVGGLIYIFSVLGSRIIHRIEVIDKVTSCCFISKQACQDGELQHFDGCVAVGTDTGKVILLDLNLDRCKETVNGRHAYNYERDIATCHIVMATMKNDEMLTHHKQARHENINFGIQLEILSQAGPILSILSMTPLRTIAVGMEDGQMLLYSLNDLHAYHLAHPPEADSPLIKLTYLEPADDPRACVYIWAFHSNADTAIAVMHSIAFETKTLHDNYHIYEQFQSCSPRLTIPICEPGSIPIACQSASKIVSDEEDEVLSLCLLGWTTRQSTSHMFLFDLNQWYKEQMPYLCDWREYPSYLAPFPVPGDNLPLDIWLDSKCVATFNSIQRPEEHFYPTSLSFYCIKLTPSECYRLHWPGLQNRALNKLSARGAVAILEPDECFAEILETSLIPQFSEHNYHANPSKRVKQEFLLSMALEYKCSGLLNECAKLWADGSHQGNAAIDGLTLSTLTDWIWSQATVIRDCCNNLCVPLFDYSGCTLDLRSRKIILHCSRQLKKLADLLNMIITECRQYIPNEIFDQLGMQRNSICMMSEYQEVLQWLLNMGLLPEVPWNQFSRSASQVSLSYTADMLDAAMPVPYPYRILHDYYTIERQKFFDIDRNLFAAKTNSCRCLYIDTFIERECNSHLLRAEWKHTVGDGLYPPPSLQAMLRILLIPGIPLENKYVLFIYLFLDLNMVLEDDRYGRVVQNLIKFPAVFKVNSALIRITQAFWNLDHKEYETAIDELISPTSNERYMTQWQQELLISSLLLRDMAHLALRALRAPGPQISPQLEMKTLLANNLVIPAFELQRSKRDEALLLEFFKICHEQKKWPTVFKLALTEKEGEILCTFLKLCKSTSGDNLQFLYLLQRNKFIDAWSLMQNIRHSDKQKIGQFKQKTSPQNLLLGAYKMAMSSSEKILSDDYLTIKTNVETIADQTDDTDEIEPAPLSSQLNSAFMKNKLTTFGGIFHRAVLSAKNVTNHWLHPTLRQEVGKKYVPFLSKQQVDFDFVENNNYKPIDSPTVFVPTAKRRKNDDSFEGMEELKTDQPAAKRKRTDDFSITLHNMKQSDDINISLLTTFKERSILMPMRTQRHNQEIAALDANDIDNNWVNLLSTPAVGSSRSNKGSPVRSERGRPQTPQSILKTRKTDTGSCSQSRRSISPTLTSGSARRSVDFDEKSLRLSHNQQRLFTSLDTSEEVPLTTIAEADDSDSNSSHTRRIKGRPPIRQSSKSNSPASTSVDEYYSPDTSKYSELEAALASAANQSQLSRSGSSSNRPSRSRSRGSTPEIESQRITRSKSRQLTGIDEGDLDEKIDETVFTKAKSSTPYQLLKPPNRPSEGHKSPKKSLSRIAVETNARKLISRRMTDEQSDDSLASPSDASVTFNEKIEQDFLKDSSMLNSAYEGDNMNISYDFSMYSKPSNLSVDYLRDISSDEGPSAQSKKQLLPIERNESAISVDENSKEHETDVGDLVSQEETDGSQLISNAPEEKNNDISVNSAVENQSVEKLIEPTEIAPPQLTVEAQEENIVEMPQLLVPTASTIQDETPSMGNISNISYERLPSLNNFLSERSQPSESFMQKYTHTSFATVEQSTIFGPNYTHFLEDNSYGQTTQPIAAVSLATAIVNTNEIFSVQEKKQTEIPQNANLDAKVGSPSDDIKLVVSDSEESDTNTSSNTYDDSQSPSDDESSNSSSTSSEEKSAKVDNDVISISSGSDTKETADKLENMPETTRTQLVRSNLISFEPTSNSIFDDILFDFPKESEGFNNENTASDVLNDVIYGDFNPSTSDENKIAEINASQNAEQTATAQITSTAGQESDSNSESDGGIIYDSSSTSMEVDNSVTATAELDNILVQQGTALAIPQITNQTSDDFNSKTTDELNEAVIIDSSTVIADIQDEIEELHEAEIVDSPTVIGDVQDKTDELNKAMIVDIPSVIEDVQDETDELNEAVIVDSPSVIEDVQDETDELNEAVIIDSTTVIEDVQDKSAELKQAVENSTITEDVHSKTDEFNQAVIIESPTSPKPIKIVPVTVETTTTSSTNKIIRDDQQPSTSKGTGRIDEIVNTENTPRKSSLRRAHSNSAINAEPSDANNKWPRVRLTRTTSVTSLNDIPTTPLRRKASSKLDLISEDAPLSTPSRPKTRRISALLEERSESPKSPQTRRRRTISESSDLIDKHKKEETPTTPVRRTRKSKETSDTESVLSTPSSRKSVDRALSAIGTPTTRSRSKPVEQVTPESVEIEAPKRRSTRAGSKQIDDDARSETSSIISTRSQSRRKGSVPPSDDDHLDSGSIKSTRSRRSRIGSATLPSIIENEGDRATAGTASMTPAADYSTSRRLTRAQLATMHKYSHAREEQEAKLANVSATPTRRIGTRRGSSVTVELSDDSDVESIASKDSKRSTTSKLSKTSKTSTTSKTSKRGRPKKT